MAGLKQIKTKIVAMNKSQTVTRAMEAVSAAKMRKAQATALRGRAYASAAASTLSRLSGTREILRHPLSVVRPVKKAMYIVITSDKGLAGALNSGVLKAAARDIAQSGLSTKKISIIAVGRKAHEFFSARGYKIEAFHPNNAEVTGEVVHDIVNEAARSFGSKADRVVIVYQNFISTFEQRPTLRTVFPLSVGELQHIVSDIKLMKPPGVKNGNGNVPQTYTVEPSEEEVIGAVLPMLASIIVYHALLETQASEHSARMVAMKSASDKAGEKQDELTLQFNKARQAAITREVSEITGGMEAMAS